MRRLIGIPILGLLLLVGATAVLAGPGGGSAALTAVGGASTVLSDVLSGLVGDGVIDQGQADAILEAVDARHEELRAERQRLREQLRGFLEDGTLSADELAQLPEDHPLRNLDQYLEDGQLTLEELRQLRGFGFGFGHRGHGWFRDGAPKPDSSPAPSSSPESSS
jgi:hypothetical protein